MGTAVDFGMGPDIHAIDFAPRGVSGVSRAASATYRGSIATNAGSGLIHRPPGDHVREGFGDRIRMPASRGPRHSLAAEYPVSPQPVIAMRRRKWRSKNPKNREPDGLTATIQGVFTLKRPKSWVGYLMFRPGGWSTRGCLWGGMTMNISAEYRFGRESGNS